MVISTSRTGATIISTKTNARNDKRGSEDERMAEVRWVYFAPRPQRDLGEKGEPRQDAAVKPGLLYQSDNTLALGGQYRGQASDNALEYREDEKQVPQAQREDYHGFTCPGHFRPRASSSRAESSAVRLSHAKALAFSGSGSLSRFPCQS